MPTTSLTRCNICEYPFDLGEGCIGVMEAYMGKDGPVEDDEIWLAVYCQDCWEHMHTDIETCQQNVKELTRE